MAAEAYELEGGRISTYGREAEHQRHGSAWERQERNEPSLELVQPWSGWWLAEGNPLRVVQTCSGWWFVEGNPLGVIEARGEGNPLEVVQASGGWWFAKGNHPLGVVQASGEWNPLRVVQAYGGEGNPLGVNILEKSLMNTLATSSWLSNHNLSESLIFYILFFLLMLRVIV